MKTVRLLSGVIGLLMVLSHYIPYVEGADQSTEQDIPVVTEGKTVMAHYTLTVEGKVLDSSKQREPLNFKVGSKQVLPGFEKAVQGMKVGEKRSFQVSPDDGYGEEDPGEIREITKDKLPPDVIPEAGMTLYAKGIDGQPMPVRIVEVTNNGVILNYNHPLVGRTLNFEVEIIDIL
jgi:peptidylprolyl isomerase